MAQINQINLRSYIRKLETLLQDEAAEEIILHARHILERYPKNGATYRVLGHALMQRNRWDEAEEVFRRLLGALPNDFVAHSALSNIYNELNRPDDAIWHLERAFDQQPNNRTVIQKLRELYATYRQRDLQRIQLTAGAVASQYLKNGLYDQAIDVLEQSLSRMPNRLDLRLLLARAQWFAGRQVDAAETALDILDQLPYCVTANRILTELWLAEERPSDAQRYLNRIQEVDPYLAMHLATGEPAKSDLFVLPELDYAMIASQQLSAFDPDWLENVGAEGEPDAVVSDGDDNAWLETIVDDDAAAPPQKKVTDNLSNLLSEDDWDTAADRREPETELDNEDLDLEGLFGDDLDELALDFDLEGDFDDESTLVEDAVDTEDMPPELLEKLDSLQNASQNETLLAPPSRDSTGLTGMLSTLGDDDDDDDWLIDAHTGELDNIFDSEDFVFPAETDDDSASVGMTGMLSMLQEDDDDSDDWLMKAQTGQLDDTAIDAPSQSTGLTGLLNTADDDEDTPSAADDEHESSGMTDLLGALDDDDDETPTSSVEIGDTDPADLFGDLSDEDIEDIVVQDFVPATDKDDPLAWMRGSGIDFDENAEVEAPYDPYGVEEDGVTLESREQSPMAWLGEDIDDEPAVDPTELDPLAWLGEADAVEDEPEPPVNTWEQTPQSTAPESEPETDTGNLDWLIDETVLDEMLDMESSDDDLPITDSLSESDSSEAEARQEWQAALSDDTLLDDEDDDLLADFGGLEWIDEPDEDEFVLVEDETEDIDDILETVSTESEDKNGEAVVGEARTVFDFDDLPDAPLSADDLFGDVADDVAKASTDDLDWMVEPDIELPAESADAASNQAADMFFDHPEDTVAFSSDDEFDDVEDAPDEQAAGGALAWLSQQDGVMIPDEGESATGVTDNLGELDAVADLFFQDAPDDADEDELIESTAEDALSIPDDEDALAWLQDEDEDIDDAPLQDELEAVGDEAQFAVTPHDSLDLPDDEDALAWLQDEDEDIDDAPETDADAFASETDAILETDVEFETDAPVSESSAWEVEETAIDDESAVMAADDSFDELQVDEETTMDENFRPTNGDDEPDWLSGFSFEEGDDSDEDAAAEPDWLSSEDPLNDEAIWGDSEAEAAEDGADWLADINEVYDEVSADDDAEADEDIPAWLADASITDGEDEDNFDWAEDDYESEFPDGPASTTTGMTGMLSDIKASRDDDDTSFAFESDEDSSEFDWLSGIDNAIEEEAPPPDIEPEPQPDWLASVDFSIDTDDTEDDEDDIPQEPEWLQGMGFVSSGEDDLDWLSATEDADVLSAQAQQLAELEAQDNDFDGDEAGESDESAALGDVPDWLSDVSVDIEDPEESDEAMDAATDTAAWLAGIDLESEMALEADASEEMDESAPDWLSDDFDLDEGEEVEEAAAVVDESAPDWMSGDFDLDEGEEIEEAAAVVDESAPDWLSGDFDLDEGEEVEEPAAIADESAPDWMSDFTLEDEGEEIEEPAAIVDESAPDWMSDDFDLDEGEEVEEAAAVVDESAPDWLSDDFDLDEGEEIEEPAAIADESAPDWMSDFTLEDEGEEVEEAVAFADESAPDWMSDDFDLDEGEEIEEPAAIVDESAPDWMSDFTLEDEGEEVEEAVAFADESAPDWMSGDFEDDTEGDTEIVEEAMPTGDMLPTIESESDTIPGDTPDWLEETAVSAAAGAAALVSAEETQPNPTVMDEEFLPEEELETSSVANAPDWLNAMVPGLDVDYDAEEEEVDQGYTEGATYRQRALADSDNGDDFEWLQSIVDEETSPNVKPAPRKWFSLSKPPAWMRRKEPAPAPKPSTETEIPSWLLEED